MQPVLRVLGDPVRQFPTGALGAGHAMKALNNVVGAATSCVIAEALAAGTRFGLDPATMIGVLNVSTGRSFVSELVYGIHLITARAALAATRKHNGYTHGAAFTHLSPGG